MLLRKKLLKKREEVMESDDKVMLQMDWVMKITTKLKQSMQL